MSTARTRCVALMGLEGRLIEVEASVAGGLPRTVLVGLPDASLYEARDGAGPRPRVRNWRGHRVW